MYPEHEKMKLIKDHSQAIGEFIEWLECHGIWLAEYPSEECQHLYGIQESTEQILAKYFEIDLKKISAEKDQMVKDLLANK